MKKLLLVSAALASLFAGQAFAACAGVNVLAGNCVQSEAAVANGSTAQGAQAILGFSAGTATNTSGAQNTSAAVSTPLGSASQSTSLGQNVSSQAGIALGGAIGAQGAAGAGAAAGNAVGVGGFGINVFALPTP
jgi:hypothetical protein